MVDSFIEALQYARESIDIITPNLNVTKLMSAIVTAANRGVKVRIILSKDFTDLGQDIPTRGGNNYASVRRMHRALEPYLNDRICERLKIRWYGLDGVNAVSSTGPPANHAKFMIIDQKITYFGSANMDNQSFVNSRELALFVDNSNLGTRWTKFYEHIYNRSVDVDECL